MRATAATTISAPIEAVWGVVSDPERALSFMSGVTRWEVQGEERAGLGARYRMLLRVGSVAGGRTKVEIRLAAGVAGSGLWGWLAERVAQPIVSSHLRATVHELSRLVEHERMRSQAAERRAARGAHAG
jgi:carbon monoxide dehydrogenase subunit G